MTTNERAQQAIANAQQIVNGQEISLKEVLESLKDSSDCLVDIYEERGIGDFIKSEDAYMLIASLIMTINSAAIVLGVPDAVEIVDGEVKQKPN